MYIMTRMKSQAALEFLTTYGWMFLIGLVAFSGLVYFGVFNTSNWIDETCKLDGTLECPLFALTQVGADYHLDLQIKNNLPVTAEITQVRLREVESTIFCELSVFTSVSSGTPMTPDDMLLQPQHSVEFSTLISDGVPCPFEQSGLAYASKKRKYEIELYYLRDGSTRTSVASGSLIVQGR